MLVPAAVPVQAQLVVGPTWYSLSWREGPRHVVLLVRYAGHTIPGFDEPEIDPEQMVVSRTHGVARDRSDLRGRGRQYDVECAEPAKGSVLLKRQPAGAGDEPSGGPMRWALALICLPLLGFQYNPPGRLQAGNEGHVDARLCAGDALSARASACLCQLPSVHAPAVFTVAVGANATPATTAILGRIISATAALGDAAVPWGLRHQGQDIRPATCADKVHWAVAAEAEQIVHIGSYSVYLVADSGRRHRYLHMAPETVPVRVGQRVERGQRLGQVSNAYFDSEGIRVGTSIHLHYDLNMLVATIGRPVFVPTYMALINSYRPLVGEQEQRCPEVPAQAAWSKRRAPALSAGATSGTGALLRAAVMTEVTCGPTPS